MLDGLSLSKDECRRFFLYYLSWRKYVSFHIRTTSPLGNCGTVITIFFSYFYFGIYLFSTWIRICIAFGYTKRMAKIIITVLSANKLNIMLDYNITTQQNFLESKNHKLFHKQMFPWGYVGIFLGIPDSSQGLCIKQVNRRKRGGLVQIISTKSHLPIFNCIFPFKSQLRFFGRLRITWWNP